MVGLATSASRTDLLGILNRGKTVMSEETIWNHIVAPRGAEHCYWQLLRCSHPWTGPAQRHRVRPSVEPYMSCGPPVGYA